MRGWSVEIRYEEDGFHVEERKNVFLPDKEDKSLAPLYYNQFDSEFSIIEKKIRRVLARKNCVRIYVSIIDEAYFSDNTIIKVFINGDNARIVTQEIDEEVSIEDAKKKLQKTLIRLKKQAKDACWIIAIA